MSGRRFYPGDPIPGSGGAEVEKREATARLSMTFEDVLDRPLTGDVFIRNEYDEPVPAEIVGGRLDLGALPVGNYTYVAVLHDPEGRIYYRNGRFSV
jgi:hypothetical protein